MDTNLDELQVFSYEGTDYKTFLTRKFLNRKTYLPDDPTRIMASIPGTIIKIMVKEGQAINPSKCLFVIDAMKMKNKIHSTMTGVVSKIHIHEGQVVAKNDLLLELEVPDKEKDKDKRSRRSPRSTDKDSNTNRKGRLSKKSKKSDR